MAGVSASFASFAVMSVTELLKTYREAHENREGFMAGVSARFAFFAVMSVIDLLKTDREAHEAREGFYDRGLSELRVLCGNVGN